jgi:hypothetical protein
VQPSHHQYKDQERSCGWVSQYISSEATPNVGN